MQRQLIDNIIDINTESRIAASVCPSGGVSALFDYAAAAFPNVAWIYLFMMYWNIMVSQPSTSTLHKLYTNARHFIRFLGRVTYAFTPKAGTKQACPLSGSLFVMVMDPIIGLLKSMLGHQDCIRGFADDRAAVIHDLFLTMPVIAAAFELISVVTNLHLKIKKTVLIPLWRCDLRDFKAIVAETLPTWKMLVSSLPANIWAL